MALGCKFKGHFSKGSNKMNTEKSRYEPNLDWNESDEELRTQAIIEAHRNKDLEKIHLTIFIVIILAMVIPTMYVLFIG